VAGKDLTTLWGIELPKADGWKKMSIFSDSLNLLQSFDPLSRK
jgi:hypothetical protein